MQVTTYLYEVLIDLQIHDIIFLQTENWTVVFLKVLEHSSDLSMHITSDFSLITKRLHEISPIFKLIFKLSLFIACLQKPGWNHLSSGNIHLLQFLSYIFSNKWRISRFTKFLNNKWLMVKIKPFFLTSKFTRKKFSPKVTSRWKNTSDAILSLIKF